MQPIKQRLQTRQDLPIHRDGERALQPRFVDGLREKTLHLYQLDLEMQFPVHNVARQFYR